MRKIIMNLAMSLDGYIADENGGYAWITGDGDASNNINAPYDFDAFMDSIDVMVMGRGAYDDCPMEMYKEKTVYVTTSQDLEDYDNIKFIKGDVVDQILELKNKEGKDIYLFGGGVSIDPFIKADVIDQYIVAIIPTILGKGRKLFHENNPEIKLKLDKISVDEGTTIMHYKKR